MARLPHYIAQGEGFPSQRVLHPGWMVYVENYIKVAHGWLNGWFMWLKWFIYIYTYGNGEILPSGYD